MSDKLDELLGLSGSRGDIRTLTSTTSMAIAPGFDLPIVLPKILMDPTAALQSGISFDDVLAMVENEGKAVSEKLFRDRFEEVRRQHGDGFAREWVGWQKISAKQSLNENDKYRDFLLKSLMIKKKGLYHAEAGTAALRDGFKFKQHQFTLGSPRLRAHEIIDQIDSEKRCLLISPVSDDPGVEVFEKMRVAIIRAQKFDIRSLEKDDIAPNAEFSYELERDGLLVLPYRDCWFEWDIEPDHTVAGIVSQEDGGALGFRSFVRVKNAGWSNWDCLPKDHPGRRNELTEHVERVCRAALVILNSRSAERTVIVPPVLTNARRERRGEQPYFSHSVIEIRGIVLNRPGGAPRMTHRSPRMHWRRGHLRRFRDESGDVYRVSPIAPMLVGRAELGSVEHDYIIAPKRHRSMEHTGGHK